MSDEARSAACPRSEDLDGFVEGTLDTRTMNEITMHLATCTACGDAASALRSRLGSGSSVATQPRALRKPLLVTIAILVIGLAGAGGYFSQRSEEPPKPVSPLARLADVAPSDYRLMEARPAGIRWAAFRGIRSSDGESESAQHLKLGGVAGEVLQGVDERSDATSMHAAGLARLLLGNSSAAVALLHGATTNAPNDARAWSDLSAAQLEQVVTTKQWSNFPTALASVDRALELDPKLSAAAFNRALILEKMGLGTAAKEAWAACLLLDSDPQWAGEAREHLAGVEARLLRPFASADLEAAAAKNDVAGVRKIVDTWRTEARNWVETMTLAQWADAVQKGDREIAEARLRMARLTGNAVREASGESLLADCVKEIDDATDVSALAAAYRRQHEGRTLYSMDKHVDAEHAFRDAARQFATAGSPFAVTSQYYVGCAIHDQGRIVEARALLQTIVPGARHYAIDAEIKRQIGLAAGKAGDWRASLASLLQARQIFEEHGERAWAGIADSGLAEVYEFIGQRDDAWEHRINSFRLLNTNRFRGRLSIAIAGAVRASIQSGRPREALALSRIELMENGAGSTKPMVLAEQYRRRALIHTQLGNVEPAWSDLRQARAAVANDPESRLKAGQEAENRLVEAKLVLPKDPEAAIALVTRSVDLLRANSQTLFLPGALLDRALSQRRLGRDQVALQDIDAAIAIVESQRDAAVDFALRERLFEQETALFEAAVDIELDRGRNERALAYADRMRGRTLLDLEPAVRENKASLLEEIRRTLAPREALVEELLLHDEVVAFVVTAKDFVVVRRPVERDRLEARIAAFRFALQQRHAEAVIREQAIALERDLIAPVRAAIGTSETLILVADRALQAVPWSALFDETRQRWLVEDFASVVTPSAAVWAKATRRVREPLANPRVLAVSSPGGDDTATLRWASDEARAVAAIYSGRAILDGTDATVARFLTDAPRFDVVHFAGHARRDRTAADVAMLFASDGGRAQVLPSAKIATLDFRRARLVVLAACGTADGDSSRLDGMPSLARSFLLAGAASVVGSLWPIDDEEAAALAVELHRDLASQHDVARALQRAQLSMLRHDRVRWRHPSAWAAIELLGASPHL